ncbi:NAD-specific glutamate dehydrogenase-domain-containing protein [Ephemerocybe angulata]|uniref:NAD-specific glutamate dehydrogenase-domain-containing protein n=1 Tax=Ephemerocybe angulata TaxID=980116 RepID=A0A8H6LTW0_9AGAR|nr:NAD-specific glutamate dehydrogenase-domain-containing protein [Tulosesus angulatus]
MVMRLDLPVVLSSAETLRIPLASMSKLPRSEEHDGRPGDARELELAEKAVVLGAGALTLVDLDKDTRLVVGVGREDLGLLGGDGGVALDEGGHDATSGLNTEGEGSDIEEEEILSLLRGVAGENGGLDSGTVDDGMGVDALVGPLAVVEVDTSLTIRGIRVDPPTRTTSWTVDLSILESRRTFSTGSRAPRNRP